MANRDAFAACHPAVNFVYFALVLVFTMFLTHPAALMLAAVITWFACYTAVMTSDKFVYLFGRIIPALSLVLSMTLRFVPKFRAQLHAVSEVDSMKSRGGRRFPSTALTSVTRRFCFERKSINTIHRLNVQYRYRAQGLEQQWVGSEFKVLFDTFSFKKKYNTADAVLTVFCPQSAQ